MAGKDFHYTVTGRWPFPLDMLRRDDSRAATSEDQTKIDALSGESSPEGYDFDKDTAINLVIPAAGTQRPLTARWKSFSWDVPTDEEYAFYEAERQRLAKLKTLRDSAYAKLTAEEIEALKWFHHESRG